MGEGKARRIAARAHRGQLTHDGSLFVDHLERVVRQVAESGGGWAARQAAWLYAVPTVGVSLEDLLRLGVPAPVLRIVDAVQPHSPAWSHDAWLVHQAARADLVRASSWTPRDPGELPELLATYAKADEEARTRIRWEIERIVSQPETADHPLVAELVERWWNSADDWEVATAVVAAGVPRERQLEKVASESEVVASAAIRRLHGEADPHEIDVLRTAVDRFEPDVTGARREAMVRLRYIGTPEARKTLLDRAFVLEDALLADHAWLVRHRAAAVPWLIDKLSDRLWHANTVHALGQAHAVEAVEQICAAARAAEFPWAHALALSTIASPEAIPTLIELGEHEDSRVRHDALIGLGRIGGPAVVDAVLKACDDPEPHVRSCAARVLTKCGDERAVPMLIRLCDGSDHAAQAADALGRIGDSRALPTLWSMFLNSHESKAARYAAGRALTRMDGPMRPGYSDDAGVARACAWLLGHKPQWEPQRELKILARHADPLVRMRAAEAFGRLGDSAGGEPVRALLDDPDHRVRTFARHALTRITGDTA